MKVLFPATHYYPVIGGIETWTREIAERLAEKAEIFIVTGKVKGQKKEEITPNGVKIWRISLFTLSNLSASPIIYSLSLLPFIFFKSLNLIKKEKIDILHCQGFLSSFLGFLLSRLTGVPYIVTVQRLERRGNFIKEMVYRRAIYCIGASRAIKAYFEAIGAKNIEIIPNGIDLARFKGLDRRTSRQKLGLDDEFVVMTAARLEKVKGIEYLVHAVDKLKEAKPQVIKLMIVGDGSDRRNLENLAKRLNLENKVKFLGSISNDKVPEYLAAADCFCLPSLREGFGIAILEALAAGLPVVGGDVGGIKDIIDNGKTGILVEPGNSQAIASAIERIYLGEKFVKAGLEKYDWDNISQQVFNVYQKALK